jgi:hypothetical protein
VSTRNDRIGENGLIIFDGRCGVCATLIGRREMFFKRHGFTIAPFQEKWVQEVTGLSVDRLGQAIHLYRGEGEVYRGIEFIQLLAEEIWWLIPLRIALAITPMYWLCEKLYCFVAARRMLISRVCKLSPLPTKEHGKQ